jgi:hypothetical protein
MDVNKGDIAIHCAHMNRDDIEEATWFDAKNEGETALSVRIKSKSKFVDWLILCEVCAKKLSPSDEQIEDEMVDIELDEDDAFVVQDSLEFVRAN